MPSRGRAALLRAHARRLSTPYAPSHRFFAPTFYPFLRLCAPQRRYGYTLQPRDGLVDLLRFLVDPNSGVFVTLWSENSSAVAQEEMEKLMQAISGPAAHTPPLSQEHIFLRDGGKRKEKRLEYFNRSPKSLLLIDSLALSEALNPNNTVCVQPQRAAAAAGAPDLTCSAIKTLVARLKEEFSSMGEVNVPRALQKLRADAAANGFDADALGMYAFLRREAAEEAEKESLKRNSGLGGLLRRSVAESAGALRRGTTVEVAARRGYRDPGLECGEDSLLTRKLRETSKRVFGQQ